MADYINRHAAIEECNNDYAHGYMYAYCLKQLPSADVVEVVRCKDCKHNPKENWLGCPMANLSEKQRPETAWCWKGERKDG